MKPPSEPGPILSSVNRTRGVGAIFSPNSQTLTVKSGPRLTDTFDSTPRHDAVGHFAANRFGEVAA
jgi:hypothetical protein